MRRKSFEEMECGIAQSLEKIGDLWSLLILRDAMFGVRTFDVFHDNLGIPKNTLSARLSDLVDNGLLARTPDPDDGRRVIYRLEQAGQELWIVLVALSQWGNKWVYNSKGAPSFVADKKSGKPVSPVEIKDSKGRKLNFRDVTMILGPSGSDSLARKFATAFRD